ncbi:MAG: hypothetical protein WCP20_16300 [Desulfuromonadales bacterium]
MPLFRVDDHIVPASQGCEKISRTVVLQNMIAFGTEFEDGAVAPFGKESDCGGRVFFPDLPNSRNQQYRITDI